MGWTSDDLELVWLKERHTKDKAGPRARRLPLVDSHSNHINMKFIDYADRN